MLITKSAFPLKLKALETYEVVVETVLEMAVRVVGGMMSLSADRRSAKVSSMDGTSSSSELISESVAMIRIVMLNADQFYPCGLVVPVSV